jgi:RIO kinase 1
VANNNAEEMFARYVNDMRHYYGGFSPALLNTRYAKEMWALFEEGKFTTNSTLTGEFEDDSDSADVDSVFEEIKAVIQEEQD